MSIAHFILLFFGGSLLFVLTGCLPQKSELTIGFSQCAGGDWRDKMDKEMQSEVRFYPGVELEIKHANGDLNTQLKDIYYFIEKRVDLLIISPLEDKKMAEAFNSIDFKGIPILLVDRNISSNKSIAFVGASNLEVGKTAAQYVLKERGELPTKVVHIQGYDKSTATLERESGFVNTLSKYPNYFIEILTSGKDLDGMNINKTKEVIKNKLETLEQADVIYAFNDEIALAVHAELSRIKSRHRPILIGIDGMIGYGKGINGVKEKQLTASIVYPQGGTEAINIGMKILNNVSVPKETLLPIVLIDHKNVDAYYYKSMQQLEQQQKIDLLAGKNAALYGEIKRITLFNHLVRIALLVVLFVLTFYLLKEKWWYRLVSIKTLGKNRLHADGAELADTENVTAEPAGSSADVEKMKKSIEAIIESRAVEETFDVNELMREFSMSRVQFYQLFKRLFHDTPNNYVRKWRLEKSKELILENKYTYAEITYKIGFSSPAYFSKCFKDEYNCTPSEFFEREGKGRYARQEHGG